MKHLAAMQVFCRVASIILRRMSATFCTPFDVSGSAALSSQPGGVGMTVIGLWCSVRMGVSAIVGLGSKSEINEASRVLLSDAVDDNGMALYPIPPDLATAFRKFIPPFGAAGNPVEITGGEPPQTYRNTVRLGSKTSLSTL